MEPESRPQKVYDENILHGIITHLEFKKKKDNIIHNLDEVLDSIFLNFQMLSENRCPECIGKMYEYLGLLDAHYKTNLCKEMPQTAETPFYGLFVPPVRIVERIKNKQKKDWRWLCSAAENVNCPPYLRNICYSEDTNKIIKRPTDEEIMYVQNCLENFVEIPQKYDKPNIVSSVDAYQIALDKLKKFEEEWDAMVKKDAKEIEKMLLEEESEK